MSRLTSLPPANPEDPLHVLHVADEEVAARFGRMLRQLGLALEEAGLRQSLLTDSMDLAAALNPSPIEVLPVRPLYGWRAWRLGRFLDQQFETPPGIVQFWGTAGLRALGGWAADSDFPVLIYVTSQDDLEELRERGLRSNEFVATASRSLWPGLAQRFPRLGQAANLLSPALLSPESNPVDARPRRAADALGILWSGVINDDAGLLTLVDGLATLRGRGCEVQAALIGWGPATHRIWKHVRERGVSDCVSLVEEPGLWDQALAGADVYVIPARQTEFSLAPLLAMSLGKLVVAARNQMADWLIEDQTVAGFAPNLAEELAAVVRRAIDGDERLLAIRRGAADYVREHHAVSRGAERLVHSYQMIREAHVAGV